MFHSRTRHAFTLVELMVVMVIIAILAAIIVPVAFRVIDQAKNTSIKMEVDGLGQAVEAYKLKYGDYPPDFSNWTMVDRHYRKAFPGIQNADLQLLVGLMFGGDSPYSSPRPHGIDAAEALVLTLGGYSDDPAAPLSGEGGPFSLTPGGELQYNPDRSNAFFDFEQDRMYLTLTQDAQGNPKTMSNDETEIGSLGSDDVLPVYHPSGQRAPYVYFESRTYAFGGKRPDGTTAASFNVYNPTGIDGAARPYKSDQMNTQGVSASLPGELQADKSVYYANRNSYQIISAGLDDMYGGVGDLIDGRPVLYQYPSGSAFHPRVSGTQYSTASMVEIDPQRYEKFQINMQLDNITNFTEGATLDNDLP